MGKFTKTQIKALDEIASRTPTVPAFADDTPVKKQERLKRAKGNDWETFRWAAKTYFPHICTKPFAPAHEEMIGVILSNPGALVALTGTRALAKTTLVAIIFTIWKFMQGYQFNVQSAGDKELSDARAKFIYNELENNIRLRYDYPKLAPAGDDQTNFHLKSKALVMSRSIRQGIHGLINPRTAKRPDIIDMDDIDDETNQGNQSIGKKKLDKITGSVTGSVDPDVSKPSYILWLGNLNHPNYAICQYEKEMEVSVREADLTTKDTKETKKGQARTHVPTKAEIYRQGNHIISRSRILLRYPLEDAQGRSIWEAQFPTSSLPELRKKMGHLSYQREMLGRAIIEGTVFKADWFKNFMPGEFKANRVKQVCLYADPARGTKGSFKAIIAIAWDGEWFRAFKIWNRQVENRSFFQRYYDNFQEIQKMFGAKMRAGIETVYGQQYILVDFDRWCRENKLPSITHYIHRVENKENKNARIERLETVIESGKLLFCQGEDYETLKMQFLTYPDGYLDGPDATAGCMEMFQGYKYGKNAVKVRGFKV